MTTLFRLLAILPLWLLHAAGAVFGWLAYLASPTYRRRFREHALLAGLDNSQIHAAVAQTGRMMAELPRVWFSPDVPIAWDGEAVVQAARARGRGVMVLTPHLGCFEAIARGYAQRFGPMTVLYRPARKPWLSDLIENARRRPNVIPAPTSLAGVKQMLKALRAGEAVGLLPDQVPPLGMGAWAPFFGRDAYTMTLSARLAQQSGAAIVLFWGERLPRGRGFLLHAQEGPGELPADPAAAAAFINSLMEGIIRQCPSQYLWGYARYKAPRTER